MKSDHVLEWVYEFSVILIFVSRELGNDVRWNPTATPALKAFQSPCCIHSFEEQRYKHRKLYDFYLIELSIKKIKTD